MLQPSGVSAGGSLLVKRRHARGVSGRLKQPESHSYESVGLTLNYSAWGDPQSPLVVVHHGFLDHGRSWDEVCEPLSEHFRVVVPDARGHGDSEWLGTGGAYYFPDYVLDLRNLLESLGDPEVRLVGHSMGSSVVSYYAGAFAEKVVRVAMVEGLGPPETPLGLVRAQLQQFVNSTRKRTEQRRELLPMPDVAEAARRISKVDRMVPTDRATRVAVHATREVRDGVVWKYDPLHRARIAVPFRTEVAGALWKHITAPTLNIRGADSRFVHPPEEHARRLAMFPDITEASVAGAGHNIHMHQPGPLAELLAAWLAG